MKRIIFFLSITLFISTMIIALVSGMMICSMQYPWHDLVVSTIETRTLPTRVLDINEQELFRFQQEKYIPVSFHKVPQNLINAFVAVEDTGFFQHHGFSWRGTVRSLLINLINGAPLQGGSTITQQLAKLLFFTNTKTFIRKIKEFWYAIMIERTCSKEQILEAYLNTIYFGNGIYGVGAACKEFWGIPVENITLEQAATLAGIVQSPNNYCPLFCPLSSERRRNILLKKMLYNKFISDPEYNNAIKKPLDLTVMKKDDALGYLKNAIKQEWLAISDQYNLEKDGLTIYTTIDPIKQQDAYAIFEKKCIQLRTTLKKRVNGGLLAIEPTTGGIQALVGGYSFKESQYNRALHAKRQMGSVFKTLIYASALMQGFHFWDTEIDEPIIIRSTKTASDGWQPRNYNRKFLGPITLGYALAKSNNIVAIKTILKTGTAPVATLAHAAHLPMPSGIYPSLALGCIDATLTQTVGMFNIFANDGQYVKPHLITMVQDRRSTVIYERSIKPEPIIPPSIAHQVGSVLRYSIDNMNKQSIKGPLIQTEVMSKTGTTNDARTCWFLGSTPDLTVGIYIGCDNNEPLGATIYPIHTAFPIWLSFMQKHAIKNQTFIVDHGLKWVSMDIKTGKLYEKNTAIPQSMQLLVPRTTII